jgi:hypothetical protein
MRSASGTGARHAQARTAANLQIVQTHSRARSVGPPSGGGSSHIPVAYVTARRDGITSATQAGALVACFA